MTIGKLLKKKRQQLGLSQGRKIKVDWKAAFDELSKAYEIYSLKTSDSVVVIPEEEP